MNHYFLIKSSKSTLRPEPYACVNYLIIITPIFWQVTCLSCVVDIPGVLPQIPPLHLPSLSFLIHFSFVILLLDYLVAITWKKHIGLTIKQKQNFKKFPYNIIPEIKFHQLFLTLHQLLDVCIVIWVLGEAQSEDKAIVTFACQYWGKVVMVFS